MCFADIDDVTNYHLVMNTSLVASETIVQIVKEIVRVKTFRGQKADAQ